MKIGRSTTPGPRLEEEAVHVFRVGLDPGPERLATLEQCLGPDERERRARMHFERHRRRFTAARGALRELLGACLGRDPSEVKLEYGSAGKPFLRPDGAGPDVRFNLSHSGDEALIAVALGREVGVDIEGVRPASDLEAIARRFFAPAEVERLLALPVDARRDAFCECWTRKEAYLKACGAGLGLPLDEFEVGFGPGEPARLRAVRWDPAEVRRWSMADVPAPAGFRAALVAEGTGWTIRRFGLDGPVS